MKTFLSFLSMLFIAGPAFAESDIESFKINDNLHLLVSPQGGNVVVSSGEDGAFLIDDQLKGRSEIVEAAAGKLGGGAVKFILNTHYHFDHTGGNEFFGGKDAVIVAHDNVRQRLSTKQFITYFSREMEPVSEEGLPVVTFSEGMGLHYNGDDIRIMHMPAGHTDGDAAAYFEKANVIVAGDLIFNGMYPFIDIEHGGSVRGVIAAMETFLELSDESTVIVPGHGKLMNRSDLQAYHDMLAAIAAKVQASIDAGQSKEEAVQAKPTADFDAKVSEGIVGPDAFAGIVYDSLKGQ